MKLKRFCAALVAVLLLSGALSASASAEPPKTPVIFGSARAIPTKSGKFARITVYAKYVRSVKIAVDGGPRRPAKRFGTGCGNKRCSKWAIYYPRTGNECYELDVHGWNRKTGTSARHNTVCEPFRDGSV